MSCRTFENGKCVLRDVTCTAMVAPSHLKSSTIYLDKVTEQVAVEKKPVRGNRRIHLECLYFCSLCVQNLRTLLWRCLRFWVGDCLKSPVRECRQIFFNRSYRCMTCMQIRHDSVGYDGHYTLQEKNRKDFKFPIVEPLKKCCSRFLMWLLNLEFFLVEDFLISKMNQNKVDVMLSTVPIICYCFIRSGQISLAD